ncbi:tRNA-specific adenosine deaminase [compost metagenome]
MKQKYLDALMDMTIRFGETSESTRLKVGAMLVKDGNPIALGVNGTRAGWHTNKCEDEQGNTTTHVRHAEVAALDKLRRSSETSEGSTLIVSHACCLPCAIEIFEAGVEKVIYKHEYRSTEGLEYLRYKGVYVVKYEECV